VKDSSVAVLPPPTARPEISMSCARLCWRPGSRHRAFRDSERRVQPSPVLAVWWHSWTENWRGRSALRRL